MVIRDLSVTSHNIKRADQLWYLLVFQKNHVQHPFTSSSDDFNVANSSSCRFFSSFSNRVISSRISFFFFLSLLTDFFNCWIWAVIMKGCNEKEFQIQHLLTFVYLCTNNCWIWSPHGTKKPLYPILSKIYSKMTILKRACLWSNLTIQMSVSKNAHVQQSCWMVKILLKLTYSVAGERTSHKRKDGKISPSYKHSTYFC